MYKYVNTYGYYKSYYYQLVFSHINITKKIKLNNSAIASFLEIGTNTFHHSQFVNYLIFCISENVDVLHNIHTVNTSIHIILFRCKLKYLHAFVASFSYFL